MRKVVTGEQVVRVTNPDPFGFPRWRPPVYETPAVIIVAVKLYRLIAWLVRLIIRHPIAALVLVVLALAWASIGPVGLAVLVGCAGTVLVIWRSFWPSSFTRWAGGPARGAWRSGCYRRRWPGVMAIAGIAPWHRGRVIVPALGKVTATRYVDQAGADGGRAVGR